MWLVVQICARERTRELSEVAPPVPLAFLCENKGLSTPSSIEVDNSERQAIETSSLNSHLRLTRKDSLVANSWTLCTQSEQVPFQRYLPGK